MKITKTTKLSQCSAILDIQALQEIENKVSEDYITKYESIVNNTVGDFIMLLRGDNDFIRDFFLKGNSDITVYEYCAKSKHLKKEIEKIAKYLKSLSTKQSEDEEQAARGVLFPTFEENILIYCQQKFYLNSFKEAENILLCDFLLHKKNDLANVKFEKNLRAITSRRNNFKK